MKREENPKLLPSPDGVGEEREALRRTALSAYAEGCEATAKSAVEAYRRCCGRLFGNRCLSPAGCRVERKKLCDADCPYIRKYESELHKLGRGVEETPQST